MLQIWTILGPMVLYWILGGMFYLFDRLGWFLSYKNKSEWKTRHKNNVSMLSVIKMVLFQQLIQCVISTYINMVLIVQPTLNDYGNSDIVDSYYSFSMNAIVNCLKIIFGLLLVDTYQYWVHWYMHVNSWLYLKIHCVHHRLVIPYAIGALYNHPLEGLLMDIVGTGAVILLFQMNVYTQLIFTCILTSKTIFDHSGYRIPVLDYIFSNNSAYHFIHHELTRIKFNLQQPCFIFWDRWRGTQWIETKDKQESK